jgi:ATP-dependent RNA helicase DDX19/DBP5
VLLQELKACGYDSVKLIGDMSFEARDRVAMQFKCVETRISIATDVVAPGFDETTVTLVINYDLLIDYETGKPDFTTYLHRGGRLGRYGRRGAAFNFVDEQKCPAMLSLMQRSWPKSASTWRG